MYIYTFTFLGFNRHAWLWSGKTIVQIYSIVVLKVDVTDYLFIEAL